MLGLVALGLTVFMIYTLVKNALVGKQLSSDDTYTGTVELIIPITARSEFYLEPWMKALESFKSTPANLKIHILIDGHHPSMAVWQELSTRLPCVELNSFLMRPSDTEAIPWMIEQISSKIKSSVVIIGDAELVPTEHAFASLSKLVSEKQKPCFALPQTAKLNPLGEAVAVLNPTLALASVFGFRKIRRNLSHPLMSIALGWMAMPLQTFQELNFSKITSRSWKQAMANQWDKKGETFILAFGEKHLLRYYPDDFKTQVFLLKEYWSELWNYADRAGLWLFLVALFLWSFPLICFFTHPFWSIASFFLLVLYRFFSKIVFQESWITIPLHPVGCLVWLGTLVWWIVTGLKTRYGSEARRSQN